MLKRISFTSKFTKAHFRRERPSILAILHDRKHLSVSKCSNFFYLLFAVRKLPQLFLCFSRYLLNVFSEARCLDWVIIFSLMLSDLNIFSQVLEKVSAFKDMTKTRLDTLMSSLEDLNDWLEEKW